MNTMQYLEKINNFNTSVLQFMSTAAIQVFVTHTALLTLKFTFMQQEFHGSSIHTSRQFNRWERWLDGIFCQINQLVEEKQNISKLLKSVGESGKILMKEIAIEEKKLQKIGSRHTLVQLIFGGYTRWQWKQDVGSLRNARRVLAYNINPVIEIGNMINRVELYLLNFKVGSFLCMLR